MEISYPGLDDQHILEEDYDEDYEPTEEEVLEYAKVLGLDPAAEEDMLYIAKEGIKAPLPKEWKPIENSAGQVYYFNFSTGESMWEHPSDDFYRRQLQQEREKKRKRMEDDAGKKKKKKGSKKVATLSKGRSVAGKPLQVPLSLDGGVPTSSVPPVLGVLPPLRAHPRAGTLAPLLVPTGMSGVGGSLTSTGESTLGRSSDLGGGRRSPAIGTIELGTVAISTKFEEEDEESDSEIGGGFKSKFGVMLAAEELGLKSDDDDGGSSEDVSRELRKVLEQGESEESDIDRPDNPAHGLKQADIEDVMTSESPSPLGKGLQPRLGDRPGAADIEDVMTSESPSPLGRGLQPRLGDRPGAADIEDVMTSESPSPLGRGLQPRLGDRPGAARGARPPPLQSGIQRIDVTMSTVTGALPESQVSSSSRPVGTVVEQRKLAEEREDALKMLKTSHADELENLRQTFAAELDEARESLQRENEGHLSSFRRELAGEQVEEERKLRREMDNSLNSLRAKIRDEEEEEEARLYEAKADVLRKLKQQLAQEQEREEKQLREDKEKAVRELKKKLQDQQATEESRLRSSASREVSELRERLEGELGEERKGVKAAYEQEMAQLREDAATELLEGREELEQSHKEEMETLLQQLKEQHQKAVDDLRLEFESAHSLEEEATELHKKAKEQLENELATALDKKRSELEEQHRSQLEAVRGQLQRELTQLREEERKKVEEELSEELAAKRTAIEQEHEVKLHQLREECESRQKHLEEQRESQSMEIEECERKKAEIEELKQAQDQERVSLDEEKRRLAEEKAEITVEREHLESLQAATAQETEQLLKKQQMELKSAIEQERKTLNSLKRSCTSVQSELQGLQEQRGSLEVAVGSLRGEEEARRTNLADLTQRIETDRQLLLKQIQQEKKSVDSLPQTNQKVIPGEETVEAGPNSALPRHSSESPSCLVDIPPGGKRVKTKPPGKERVKVAWSRDDGGSVSDESATTAGSLQIQELATPTPKKQTVSESEESSMVLKGVKTKMAENQRELRRALAEEQDSLVKRREDLRRQQQALRRKQRASSHQQEDVKATRTRHGCVESNDMSLLRDVQSRLQQEATTLRDLEVRMKSSRLKHTEPPQPSDTYTTDQDSDAIQSPHLDLDDIPSPTTYLTRLRERLEKHTTTRPPMKHAMTSGPLKLQLSSDESSGVSSDSTCELSTAKVVQWKPRPSHSPSDQENDIMVSLNKINSQLGQLLGRLNHPGPLHTPGGLPIAPPPTNRWADPVRFPDMTDMELQQRRNAYLGGHSRVEYPAIDMDLRTSRTRDLLHGQTDWLKEFQQSVPLSSRLHSTPHIPLPKPRLTLDSRNNVQLVHM